MVGPTESKVLKIVEELGETGAHAVSRKINIDPNYARLILNSLTKSGYLDYLARGRYRITSKGEGKLEMKRAGRPLEDTREGLKKGLTRPTIVWRPYEHRK